MIFSRFAAKSGPSFRDKKSEEPSLLTAHRLLLTAYCSLLTAFLLPQPELLRHFNQICD
jgi:hypothetical protein